MTTIDPSLKQLLEIQPQSQETLHRIRSLLPSFQMDFSYTEKDISEHALRLAILKNQSFMQELLRVGINQDTIAILWNLSSAQCCQPFFLPYIPLIVQHLPSTMGIVWFLCREQVTRDAVIDQEGLGHVLDYLNGNQEDTSLTEYALSSLVNMAKDRRLKSQIVRCNGHHSILCALRSHATIPIIEAAIGAIGNLTHKNPINRNLIQQEHAIPSIIQQMKEHRTVSMQEWGCYCLWNSIVDCPNAKQDVIDQHGVALVLNTMREFRQHNYILEQSCGILMNLGTHLDTHQTIVQQGGLELINEILLTTRDDLELQEWGLRAIEVLIREYESHLFQFYNLGAFETVLPALHKIQHPGVYDAAIRVMVPLLRSRRDILETFMNTDEFVEILVEGMRAESSTDIIKAVSCSAITAIAHHDDYAALLGRKGIFDSIQLAMQSHPDSIILQTRAFQALQMLLFSCDNNQREISLGCIRTVIAMLILHPTIEDIQDCGCAVLRNLGLDSENNIRVASEGGLGVALAALRRFLPNESVLNKALQAVWILCLTTERKRQIIREGGLAHVYSAMRRYPDNVAIQGICCGIFKQFVMYYEDDMHAVILKCYVDAVITAILRHQNETSIQSNGFGYLRHAMREFETSLHVSQKEIMGPICDILGLHPKVEDVQANALGTLAMLCVFRENRERIKDTAARDRCQAALKAHCIDDAVVESCFMFYNFYFSNLEVMPSLREVHMVVYLMKAGKTHHSNEFWRQGCIVLSHWCKRHSLIKYMALMGASDAVLAALDARTGDKTTVESAWIVLQSISLYLCLSRVGRN